MSEDTKIIKIQVSFDIGDTVYIGTDEDQAKHIVIGYAVRDNEVLYELYNHNSGEYVAYKFEISKVKYLS